MKQLFCIIILALLVLSGCKKEATGTWKNESIDQNLRQEIKTLDNRVMESILAGDPKIIVDIMSLRLKERSIKDIDQFIDQANEVIHSRTYETLDQYYVRNSGENQINKVSSGDSAVNDYVIQYQAVNKESFVSLIIPKDTLYKFLITNIYGKYGDTWKLNIFKFGLYKINGMTAEELYAKAKSEMDKGFLADAVTDMSLSSQTAFPANNFWKYQKDDVMKKFFKNILSEFQKQYQFPMTVDDIATKPQILNIYPQDGEDGYYPSVAYLTKIDLTDTVKIVVENNLLHEEIGRIFKGLDKGKNYLIYTAYNQIPNPNSEPRSYRIVKKLESESN